jgi:hypothetical protein
MGIFLEVGDLRFFAQALSSFLCAQIFFSHTNKGEPIIFIFQNSDTTSWNPSWLVQSGMNQKGIGPKFSPGSRGSKKED